MLDAQILNFVVGLRDRIAEASQNHRRNPEYPEIPQLFMRDHMSSIPPVKSWCRDDWRFTSGTIGRSDSERATTFNPGSHFISNFSFEPRGSTAIDGRGSPQSKKRTKTHDCDGRTKGWCENANRG